MRHEVLRLAPGADLRASLEEFFRMQPEDVFAGGFVVSGMGSLSQAVLRYAGRDEGSHVAGPLELVSLAGTLTDGGVHLHASVAGDDGQMLGGHVLHGCIVRTTAEIVLGLLPTAWGGLAREVDPATGYAELVVRRNPPG